MSRKAGIAEKPCAQCGEKFMPYRDSHIACSRACRHKLDKPEENRKRRVGESADPEARRAINRKQNYKRYGVTPEEVAIKVESQGGRCAICDQLPSGRGIYSKLHVDHDHRTGRVRDMLYSNCNRALGMLGDSLEILKAAAAYLDRHG